MACALGVVALFVLGVLVACAGTAAASCDALSPAQLFLNAGYQVPYALANAVVIQMPALGDLSLPPRGGALVTLQVLPAQMVDVADQFVAGVDYTGCIDAASGAGTVSFRRAGPYIVRLGYADGHVDHLEVHVVSVPAGAPSSALAGGGSLQGFREITSIPAGAKGYRDAAFAGDPTGHSEQSNLADLVSKIRSDQVDAGQPIDIALRYHGSSGQISIGKDLMGLGPRGMENLRKFCLGVKGKVKSVTLLSCRTGKGQKGCEFIKQLSSCLGDAPVNAMTGRVTTTWRNNNPSGTVKFVQNDQQTSSGNCP